MISILGIEQTLHGALRSEDTSDEGKAGDSLDRASDKRSEKFGRRTPPSGLTVASDAIARARYPMILVEGFHSHALVDPHTFSPL